MDASLTRRESKYPSTAALDAAYDERNGCPKKPWTLVTTHTVIAHVNRT